MYRNYDSVIAVDIRRGLKRNYEGDKDMTITNKYIAMSFCLMISNLNILICAYDTTSLSILARTKSILLYAYILKILSII